VLSELSLPGMVHLDLKLALEVSSRFGPFGALYEPLLRVECATG
jgi:hypothetical protein